MTTNSKLRGRILDALTHRFRSPSSIVEILLGRSVASYTATGAVTPGGSWLLHRQADIAFSSRVRAELAELAAAGLISARGNQVCMAGGRLYAIEATES